MAMVLFMASANAAGINPPETGKFFYVDFPSFEMPG